MRLVKTLLALVAGLGLCAATGSARELQVGFVYVSPIGDTGWTYAHDVGRREIDAMEGVATFYVDSVAEGPDSEQVFLNMARKGYDLIFGTSFGYMEPMLEVASQFPDTIFMHCFGLKTADNLGNYSGRMYQAHYLSGMVAGGMTRSNTVGYVAPFPTPVVIRGINAFTLGVQAVNPNATVRVVWSKTWYDPATEKEAANSLLDIGADVIAQQQDSTGPQEAAQEKGVYSIGYNSDMSAFAPSSHLTAPVWNWGPYYKSVVQAVQSGTWRSGPAWLGMREGVVDLAPFGPMVPQGLQDKVNSVKAEIVAGNKIIFTGPIKDQQGNVRFAEGVAATDEELLGMTWFVEGVIGTAR